MRANLQDKASWYMAYSFWDGPYQSHSSKKGIVKTCLENVCGKFIPSTLTFLLKWRKTIVEINVDDFDFLIMVERARVQDPCLSLCVPRDFRPIPYIQNSIKYNIHPHRFRSNKLMWPTLIWLFNVLSITTWVIWGFWC